MACAQGQTSAEFVHCPSSQYLQAGFPGGYGARRATIAAGGGGGGGASSSGGILTLKLLPPEFGGELYIPVSSCAKGQDNPRAHALRLSHQKQVTDFLSME